MTENTKQSPFPGMNPYIEALGRWASFHSAFLGYCMEQLNETLPDSYVATLSERVELIDDQNLGRRTGSRGPDVSVSHDPSIIPSNFGAAKRSLVTLEPTTLPNNIEMFDLPTQISVQVTHLPDENLITDIEALSPSNKRAGSRDRLAYLTKRQSLLVHSINLVEFDLLLVGARLPLPAPLPRGDYFAFITHGPNWHESDIYAWSVRDPLPTIPVPLLPEDGAILLDLASAFRLTYEKGRFARQLRYGDQLIQSLGEADRVWATEVIAAARE